MAEEEPASKKDAKKKTTKKTAVNKPEKEKTSEHAAGESATPEQEKESAPLKERRKPIEGRRADDKIMPGLLRNLEGIFDKIHNDNRDRDRTQDHIAEEFTEHVQQAFDDMHAQLEEREQLLDAKLEAMDRTQNYQMRRVKLMSIPVVMLSLIAVVYLFYVVRVMEIAMTSMSKDIHQITAYMEVMRTDTYAMSNNTAYMNTQMEVMNNNIGSMNNNIGNMNSNIGNINANMNGLRVDMHQLSRSVSPTMSNMNRFMP